MLEQKLKMIIIDFVVIIIIIADISFGEPLPPLATTIARVEKAFKARNQIFLHQS